jgi:hypothetical protein
LILIQRINAAFIFVIDESPLRKQGHPGLGAAQVNASIRAFNPAGAGHRIVDEMFSLTYCLRPV